MTKHGASMWPAENGYKINHSMTLLMAKTSLEHEEWTKSFIAIECLAFGRGHHHPMGRRKKISRLSWPSFHTGHMLQLTDIIVFGLVSSRVSSSSSSSSSSSCSTSSSSLKLPRASMWPLASSDPCKSSIPSSPKQFPTLYSTHIHNRNNSYTAQNTPFNSTFFKARLLAKASATANPVSWSSSP